LRVVHVAGTNGKGSVSAMIESALRAAGLRTGLYTSPHLHSFRERIRVCGEPLQEDEVAKKIDAIRTMLDASPDFVLTFFEITTLLAFEAFRDAACDVVVLEVGLGGRFDATNVIASPLVSVVTSIGLDHQAYLGETKAAIAFEKAGIIKPHVPLVMGRLDDEAKNVVMACARESNAPIAAVDWSRDVGSLALSGAFQQANARVAAAALDVLAARGIPADIERGFANVRWPGRLETIAGAPSVLLDAAHNPDGARVLVAHLASLPRSGRRVLVFGAMADKDWATMLDILRPCVDEIVAVAPNMPRAELAENIARSASGVAAKTIREGVDLARERAGEDGLVIVAGSIFVLAEARAHVLGIESEPSIRM
jgi:dihydrofolate synthase/folylpolyglutamate synthase